MVAQNSIKLAISFFWLLSFLACSQEPVVLNKEALILDITLDIRGEMYQTTPSNTGSIGITLKEGVVIPVSATIASLSISQRATTSLKQGDLLFFTEGVTSITLISENTETTTPYTITLKEVESPQRQSQAALQSLIFTINNIDYEAIINGTSVHTVIPFGSKEATIKSITVSPGASSQPNQGSSLSFSEGDQQGIITVTAASGNVRQDYFVNTQSPPITSYTNTDTLGQAIMDMGYVESPLIDTMLTVSNLLPNTTFFYWSVKEQKEIRSSSTGEIYFTKQALQDADFPSQGGRLLLTAHGVSQVIAIYEPTQIRSWKDLQAMRHNLSRRYTLLNDIIFSDENNDLVGDYNFSPIKGKDPASDAQDRFSGSLAGNGHTITYLNINRQNENNVGLFGYLASSSVEISDLILESALIRGKDFVGSIAGSNKSGKVVAVATSVDVSGEVNVGGLVGGGSGSITGYTTGTITAKLNVGGLAGYNGTGNIQGYSEATIKGQTNVGGLLGGSTTNVYGYFTGKVEGTTYVGGLVGRMRSTATSTQLKGYSRGEVLGENYVGGLVGYGEKIDIEGYTRGTIRRTQGSAGNFGLITGQYFYHISGGNIIGKIKAYHTDPTSQIIDITLQDSQGKNGVQIQSGQVQQSDFSFLTFGNQDGNWTWEADNKWPAINIEKVISSSSQPLD